MILSRFDIILRPSKFREFETIKQTQNQV
uniref:Uncharacterized protein n=1 Tax=Rhizophora mucronata TaxID=61149 RepID=A0A2P2J2M5_RHIMU